MCQELVDGDTLGYGRIRVIRQMLTYTIIEIQFASFGKLANSHTSEHLVQRTQIELRVDLVRDVEALTGETANVVEYWDTLMREKDAP